ncbi:MAG: hypothetical protein NZZ41_00970, partial [Candidatus Dojkabacteria bacterium]|nr:hypothetical protein [Candidatus Dojkabacteria bacterium]
MKSLLAVFSIVAITLPSAAMADGGEGRDVTPVWGTVEVFTRTVTDPITGTYKVSEVVGYRNYRGYV